MDQERDAVITEAAAVVEAPAPPDQPHFSPVATLLFGTVLVACLTLFGWLQVTIPPLQRLADPEPALAVTVGRSLDLEGALAGTPAAEQFFYQTLLGTGTGELDQSIVWYEELAGTSDEPLVHLYLAILEGAAGRTKAVRDKIRDWERRDDPWPALGRLLRAAYLEGRLDAATEQELQAELAELVPAGWFYDQVALRLAQRAGDHPLEQATQAAATARAQPLVGHVRALATVQGTVLVLGLLALLAIIFRGRRRRLLPIGTATMPPPWRGRTGAAVLIRGGAIGAVLTLLVLFVEAESLALRLVITPLTALPLLLLANRHLLQPAGLRFREGLGLWPMPGTLGMLGLATLALAALGFLGESALDLIAESLAAPSHWTEWFDADLVWGPEPLLGTALLEYLVFAPVFEELVFRGLLFGTLRRRLGFAAAAFLSAGVFALAHGYGALGFASVFWSGLLWAWAYEKTGSLLPSMAAHALNNLLVCLSVIGVLRA